MTTVLTIGGSDPTGGAGVQADLQVFGSLGCHGAGVITSITIQDTQGVQATYHLPAEHVRDQLVCLLNDVTVDAIKTGMLGTAATVEALAEVLGQHRQVPVVVDPVMCASSGCELLDEEGVEVLRRRLLPRATLVTPNLGEAERLTGMRARSVAEMRKCARWVTELGAQAALVTGGHLTGDPVDVLCIGGECREIGGVRIAGRPVHGTGCALASAAAVFLAEGCAILQAAEKAKAYVAVGIARARAIGSGAKILAYGEAARAVRGQ